MSSFGLRLGVKTNHLSRVEQAARVVLLLGLELNVIGAEAASVFKSIHMRVGDEYADFAAVGDKFIQPLFSSEIDQWNSARDDRAFAIFHELDVEDNLLAIALAQQPELLHAIRRRKTGLNISPR